MEKFPPFRENDEKLNFCVSDPKNRAPISETVEKGPITIVPSGLFVSENAGSDLLITPQSAFSDSFLANDDGLFRRPITRVVSSMVFWCKSSFFDSVLV